MAVFSKLSKTKKISVTKKAETKKTTRPAKKPVRKTAAQKPERVKKPQKYFEAVGRRKTAVARVRLFACQPFEAEKARILVNQKSYEQYFPILDLEQIAAAPLIKMRSLNRFEVVVKVKGGGRRGQAEAIRHGLSRALVKFNPEFSKKLKRAGYLRRDPRQVERKKFGLKKARRAPQWQKR